ncbi:hypothetical protein Ade02nite_09190 [Paractinoplanes deccanensis]|uniref:DICT domain-containing protein n=1 Tax=Paractinoplanes deccanensis TaxID=113561 RepID=A0ABQ3XX05_9ACTN|nr:DICT sensory domain-containing protein [Actinoplanes deccanensis]GID72278.1 hypothetical protein Ade02nite_09190 [Actinoplanes deccanensis]
MLDATAARRLTKRTLVTVSHAIEQAALAAAEDGPMVVFALFQRMPYFDRERQVYEQIALRAAATVVGLVATEPPALPGGVHAVLLDDKEELAREWTVVVLTPRFGAVLVAHDLEQVQPAAPTLESGRLFEGRSSFRRDEALHEALRLRTQLGDRLPPAARTAVDAAVERVRDLPATPGESRADAALRLFADQAELLVTRRRADAPALREEAEVQRWTGAAGVTASGVLPVAMLAVRVTHAAGGQEGPIGRTATRQQQAAVELLVARLRPGDRATKAGDDFLLYLPNLSRDDAVSFAYAVVADFAAAAPFLDGTVTVALTVTRRRPLPEDQLRQALDWALTQNAPVVTLPPD